MAEQVFLPSAGRTDGAANFAQRHIARAAPQVRALT